MNLGLAGEYAVASELCRRVVYAQITLGKHKRADLLAETERAMVRIQAKAKQGREWPGCRGILVKREYESQISAGQLLVDDENIPISVKNDEGRCYEGQYEGMGVLVKRPAVQGLYPVYGTKVFRIGKA